MAILQLILFMLIGLLSIEQYMEYIKPFKKEILILDIQIALMMFHMIIEYINYKKNQRYKIITSAFFSAYIILRSFENFNPNEIWMPQIAFVVFLGILIFLNVFIYPKKDVLQS